MNFGETLSYWYLRLNGFFPLSNFVLHRAEDAMEYSADADLLAIRPPHVYEVIGGQEADWDTPHFLDWGIDLLNETVGILVEVKTGRKMAQVARGVNRAFADDSLEYGVHRLGFWKAASVDPIIQEWHNKPIYRDQHQRIVVAKLLIADQFPPIEDVPPCLKLSLRDAEGFVIRRMQQYRDPKMADRMFFPSDLIQYLIWREHNH